MTKISALHVPETLRVYGFQICFSLHFPISTNYKCRQTVLLYVLKIGMNRYTNINKQSHRRRGRQTYRFDCSEEVHTETTLDKRRTSNPQRTQTTKVISSYDSRNNIFFSSFPLSLLSQIDLPFQ